MRYPADQKAETHTKILDAASRSFREQGSEGFGIARFMHHLGLTVGGFYKHFESKDDLYVAAISRGLEQAADTMLAAAQSAPKSQALRRVIEYYLSFEHLNDVANGCVLAALAPEMSRQTASVRKPLNAALDVFINRLLPLLPGKNDTERRRQFFLFIPPMAGVLMTARALNDQASQRDVLSSARSFFLAAFTEKVAT